jgi:hypothetical protein
MSDTQAVKQRISVGDARVFIAKNFQIGDLVTTRSFEKSGFRCDTNVLNALTDSGELSRKGSKFAVGSARKGIVRVVELNCYEVAVIREEKEIVFSSDALLSAMPISHPAFHPENCSTRVNRLRG